MTVGHWLGSRVGALLFGIGALVCLYCPPAEAQVQTIPECAKANMLMSVGKRREAEPYQARCKKKLEKLHRSGGPSKPAKKTTTVANQGPGRSRAGGNAASVPGTTNQGRKGGSGRRTNPPNSWQERTTRLMAQLRPQQPAPHRGQGRPPVAGRRMSAAPPYVPQAVRVNTQVYASRAIPTPPPHPSQMAPAPQPTPATTRGPAPASVTTQTGIASVLLPDMVALGPDQSTIFGIRMGEPLALPPCSKGSLDVQSMMALVQSGPMDPSAAVPVTCLQAYGPLTQKMGQRLANLEGAAVPAGIRFDLVRLDGNHCPNWVAAGCTVSVASLEGVVIGLSFLTVGDADTAAEEAISEKYGKPTSRSPATCQNNASAQVGLVTKRGINRDWVLSQLDVGYRPVNGLTCEQGSVLVQTKLMTKLIQRGLENEKARQPKM